MTFKPIPFAPFGTYPNGKEVGINIDQVGARTYDLDFIANNCSILPLQVSPTGKPEETLTEVTICTSIGKNTVCIAKYNKLEELREDYYHGPIPKNYDGFRPFKFYQHTACNTYLRTYGTVNSTYYGEGILGENSDGTFQLCGYGEEHYTGWVEITEDKYWHYVNTGES